VYTGQITVPNAAMTGPTRMRVTAKMCSHGGHTLPTPCDLPPDPFGYHGELEDYTADIVDAVGIPEIDLITGLTASATELHTTIRFGLLEAGDVRLEVLDVSGRLLLSNSPQGTAQGEQVIVMPALAEQGVYIGRLWLNGRPYMVRFFR
jgi:GEVED domain